MKSIVCILTASLNKVY